MTNPPTPQQRNQNESQAMPESAPIQNNETVAVIGISGPSSSGKTTLARLLQSIFAHVEDNLRTFIIHEDDFYLPDDKIPLTTTASGTTVQDWDTIEAIDVPFLTAALAYVREHGQLPPRLKSKEDLNEASESGVGQDVIVQLREEVKERLAQQKKTKKRTIALLEGFLLYSPPESEVKDHVLRPVHNNIDVHLFLPASYDSVKERREGRSGYVTIGPAPVPTELPQRSSIGEEVKTELVDLQKEDDAPPQNFWTDPPGYVDDIVWPRYVQDHAWLLLPEAGSQQKTTQSADVRELLQIIGKGINVRTDAGVTVAPGQGSKPMVEILKWAVEEVMKSLEATEQ